MDDYNDVIIKLYKPGRHNDEVLKATQIAEIFDTVVPNFLEKIEERCGQGEFLVGKTLTCADFYIGGMYTNYVANDNITFAKD